MSRLPRLRPLPAAAALAALALTASACGGSSAPLVAPAEPAPAADSAASNESAAPAPTGGAIAVSQADSPLGPIMVGEGGLTVYGFTNDQDGASVCNGTCAEAWPPVIVGPDWDVAPGLDAGIFNTTTRDDGSLQLVAGKWPLYYYGGDVAAGDINGQGNGEVWFVVGLDGVLITDDAGAGAGEGAAPAGPPVSVGSTELGDALVDSDGLTLYGFLNDDAGEPTCFEACADAWPPVLVPSATLPEGLDPEIFSVVPFEDGFMLKAGKWPLYRFAGDAAPGDINGQGSGDVWFVAAPDGGLLRPDAVAAADSGAGSTESDY